jgi:hypothetical protein
MRALLSKFFACLRKSRSLCTLLVPNSEETRGHGQSMMNSRLSEMMYAKHSEIPNNNNLLLVERSKKVYYHHDIYIYNDAYFYCCDHDSYCFRYYYAQAPSFAHLGNVVPVRMRSHFLFIHMLSYSTLVRFWIFHSLRHSAGPLAFGLQAQSRGCVKLVGVRGGLRKRVCVKADFYVKTRL